ncbi:MAG: hypothetical protein ACK41D_02635 [Rubricoccaceae bacterium]
MRVLLIGAALVALLLYALNPGPERFREFLREEAGRYAEQQARQRAGGGAAGDVAGFLAGRLGRDFGSAASDAFRRDNYHLFSIYEVDLLPRRPGGEFRFLGIANVFLPLERPEGF